MSGQRAVRLGIDTPARLRMANKLAEMAATLGVIYHRPLQSISFIPTLGGDLAQSPGV